MAKKIVQDVLPPENKSIRNIPLSNKRQSASAERVSKMMSGASNSASAEENNGTLDSKRATPKKATRDMRDLRAEYPSINTGNNGKKNFFSHKGLWITSVVCLLVVAFAISFLFVSAQVDIKPKTETVEINAPLTLAFQTVTVSKEFGKIVEASGEEKVEKKASGRIIIYNKNSKTSQKLVAGTRFETSKGLIYKIAEAVTIPGYTTKGTELVPGSVGATVFAEKTGDAYNAGLLDFTIPGFKGDPKYTNVYARSDTPMQGGFSGTMKKVTAENLAKAEEDIKAELKDQLTIEVRSQIPDNFILYPGAVSFSFESMPQTENGETSVKINEKGTITGVILDKDMLNRELSSETLTQAAQGDVYVSNLEDLEFLLPTGTTLPSTSSGKEVPFILRGQSHFVWIFDQEKIKKDLAGKPKKNMGSVLSVYPSIEKAKAVLHPFWKRSFPSDISKINVKITTE